MSKKKQSLLNALASAGEVCPSCGHGHVGKVCESLVCDCVAGHPWAMAADAFKKSPLAVDNLPEPDFGPSPLTKLQKLAALVGLTDAKKWLSKPDPDNPLAKGLKNANFGLPFGVTDDISMVETQPPKSGWHHKFGGPNVICTGPACPMCEAETKAAQLKALFGGDDDE